MKAIRRMGVTLPIEAITTAQWQLHTLMMIVQKQGQHILHAAPATNAPIPMEGNYWHPPVDCIGLLRPIIKRPIRNEPPANPARAVTTVVKQTLLSNNPLDMFMVRIVRTEL